MNASLQPLRPFAAAAVLLTALAAASTLSTWTIGPFTRPVDHPILSPDPAATFPDPILHQPVRWQALHTFNPAAIVHDHKLFVLFRAEDDSGSMQIGMHTSRLGLASSTDGQTFIREPAPVFFPANDSQKSREWPGGTEDPRLVESPLPDPQQRFVLTYTQWNRQTYTIGLATSPDLHHWTKHGPIFQAAGPRYQNLKYKSGGIVTEVVHTAGAPGQPDQPRLVAARVNGRFLMLWGEITVHLATSPDLIHWTPIEDPATHQPVTILSARPGHFDSGFPEVGPPPVLTPQGIVVVYNGKNSATAGDPALGPNAYATGEVLLSAQDPTRILQRLDHPVLQPTEPWEKTGQYAAGTTFAEGLVLFPVAGHTRWLLLYGCADSAVGLAQAPFFSHPAPATPDVTEESPRL